MNTMATGEGQIELPGFGRPLDVWDHPEDNPRAAALSAVKDWDHPVLTVRERCMLLFMNSITDKPGWEKKVYDDEIVAKWSQEAEALDWNKAAIAHGDMSPGNFNHCIAELRAKAAFSEKSGMIPILDSTSCVLKSDTAISADIKEELRNAVRDLEDVPDHQKDWHPGSDGQVLDLVHPSLFPLIYQRSRILPDSTINLVTCLQSIGKGTILPDPQPNLKNTGDSHLWSSRFQWLPCDVSFPDGKNARIDSYINNLHPVDHKGLYTTIEKLITKAVPFWDVVYRCNAAGDLQSRQRLHVTGVKYTLPEGVEEYPTDDQLDDDEFDEDEYYDQVAALRIYDKPEAADFKDLYITPEDVTDPFKLFGRRDKKLQVIVKLANIHLTPEQPEYAGGSWHIEGQLNEHIVATALYYYDNDNITDSQLFFRTRVDGETFSEHLGYEQGDFGGIEKIFGIENEQDQFQDIGSVLTKEDRLIAFPNGFQHRVGDFKLVDPSKPGHRKIVALFLVAPTIPIISTANVPPQRRDWWLREVEAQANNLVSNLPTELIEMVAERVDDFPIGLEEAKELRQQLMVERGRLDEMTLEAQQPGYGFNFCYNTTSKRPHVKSIDHDSLGGLIPNPHFATPSRVSELRCPTSPSPSARPGRLHEGTPRVHITPIPLFAPSNPHTITPTVPRGLNYSYGSAALLPTIRLLCVLASDCAAPRRKSSTLHMCEKNAKGERVSG
ncbi:hypothetical protein LEMA_P065820.1 [Plenodomus lingam JN3]|uniref:Uncharacterized protein n=1 Tax=Leptosphaeria maculans (strain JN3 / isolate v23.1.3 / race Av1-4-5-6-7-8) TaxID=985895 RepID=E4ZGN6_LEPMJ|nr:hypothetical protein LEMA_P065820.1 [Plenodomus lingam JN3]CBX90456.1 hypothetical protein LEMA_P065820.1 [Plenodomus lingam JN3]